MPIKKSVGRPRTTNIEKPKRSYNKKSKDAIIKVENQELSANEVFDVLRFAQNAYNGSYGFPGIFTPELVASRLKDVATNPSQATLEKINSALLDPKNNENNLVGYSEFFDLTSILYRRILHYISDMLSWNINYISTNVKDPKEYKSDKYEKDFAKVIDFFYRMDIKNEFRMALKEMIRRETFYSFFRDDGDKYVFQELPRERCKITARWDYGLVFDFDMLLFLLPGVDIDLYPPIFKEYYNDVFKNGKPDAFYNPATLISDRSSSWVYWRQTSPEDGFWAFKMSPEVISNIPMFAPLFPDLVSQPIIRSLQQNSYMQMAAKLVTSSVPYLNKDAKGSVRGDNISITPETLGKFLNILRQAVSQVISVTAMPTEDIKALEFTGNTEIYDSYLKSTASLSGVNSRLIYSHDRQNILETQSSIDIDKYLVKPVYSYFENFLNYVVNKRTKYYKFKFTLHGTEFTNEKEKELDDAIKLANLGMVLPQKFSNALNLYPWDFQKQLDEARIGKFVDKLTPIVSSFNQSSDQQKNGRPQKSVGDLASDDTQSAGSNLEKQSDE